MAGHLNGDHHLLPRHREGPIHLERSNGLRVLEAERAALGNGERVQATAHDAVDAIRARGVPIVGPGTACGAILGTRPDHAVLSLDKC